MNEHDLRNLRLGLKPMKIECPECHFAKDVPKDKVPASASLATCPKCGHKFRFRNLATPPGEPDRETDDAAERDNPRADGGSQPPEQDDIWSTLESLGDLGEAEEAPGSAAGRSARESGSIPWEELQAYGFFPGFYQTLKRVMLAPGGFFRSMVLGRGYNKPLIFYLLVAEIQALAQFFWQMTGFVPQMQNDAAGIVALTMTGFGSILIILLYPIIMTIRVFIASSIYHLFLKIFQGGSRGFEGTFRVVSYANAPMIITIFPSLIPFLIAGIWSLVCTFIGFKTIHQTTQGKALAAIFLPFILILVLSSLIFMVKGIPQM